MRFKRRSIPLLAATTLMLLAVPTLALADSLGEEMSSASASAETAPEGETPAEAYARYFGVDLADASRAIELRPQLSRLMTTVPELAGDRLIGSRIVHDPLGVEVLLNDGPEIPLLEALAAESAGLLTLTYGTATFSKRDLENLADDFLRSQGSQFPGLQGVYVNEESGVLTFDADGASTDVESLHRALADFLPTGISVSVHATTGGAGDARRGGLKTTTCTTGFTIASNSSGVRGVTTAGHCANSQDYYSYAAPSSPLPMSFVAESRSSHADVQRHTPTLSSFADYYGGSTSVVELVLGTVARADVPGDLACKRGRTTGYTCGHILSASYRPTYSGACPGTDPNTGTYTCAYTWGYSDDLDADGGDSGGPVFFNGMAYGTIKGKVGRPAVVFMPIGYVKELNAHVVVN